MNITKKAISIIAAASTLSLSTIGTAAFACNKETDGGHTKPKALSWAADKLEEGAFKFGQRFVKDKDETAVYLPEAIITEEEPAEAETAESDEAEPETEAEEAAETDEEATAEPTEAADDAVETDETEAPEFAIRGRENGCRAKDLNKPEFSCEDHDWSEFGGENDKAFRGREWSGFGEKDENFTGYDWSSFRGGEEKSFEEFDWSARRSDKFCKFTDEASDETADEISEEETADSESGGAFRGSRAQYNS